MNMQNMPESYGDKPMLCAGKLGRSLSGRWMDSINPADESVLCRVPLGSAEDIDEAVKEARKVQPGWAGLSPPERAKYMYQVAEELLGRADEIVKAEVVDTGNTITAMRNDVQNAADKLRFFAGLCYETRGMTVPSTPGNVHYTIQEPYGVVGRIFAFNHPLSMAVGAISAPLVAGNAVVEKPAEQTPLTATLFAEIVDRVLPKGLVSIITGTGAEAGDALVRHLDVKRIAFVGSVETGMKIQRSAAEVGVKHVSLELGGKNPMIVFPDADFDNAVAAAVRGMNFSWQGQSCASTSRCFVHASIYDQFVDAVAQKVEAIRVGQPLDPASEMGPINSAGQYEKVKYFINAGKEDGARLVAGGQRPDGAAFEKGYWIRPTVFADVKTDMRIAQREIFGPVLSIFRWSDFDQVIEDANSTTYGLTGAVWTNDINTAIKTASRLQTGHIWINGVSNRYRGIPYGGYKNSGVGRDSTREELVSYMEEKSINIIL